MSDWQRVCIGDIANIPKKKPIANPKEIELLTVRLYAKGVERSGKYPRETERGRPYFARDADEILIGRQNFHNGGIGIVGKADHGLICSNAITSLIPTGRADKNFLFYLLSSFEFRNTIQKQSEGTGQSEISESKILSLELTLPPLHEQKKIAEVLSGIDNAIDKDLNLLSRITMQYQGILSQVFSDASNKIQLDNWYALGELELEISDGNYSSKYPSAEEFVERGIPFIRASNMKNGTICDEDMRYISEKKHEEITKGHLKSGDILIANRGEIGKTSKVPERHIGSNINAQVVRINGGGKIDPSFLFHYLSSPFCQALIAELTTGTALKQLPIGNLVKLLIPVPSVRAQNAIGGALDSVQSVISAISESGRKKTQLKHAVASDLLSGRKRVSV